MHVLFEEDGAFKAGTILTDNTTSLQVELASGKRSKVKTANVLLRFEAPAPEELLARAERDAAEIDVDFLWQACPDAELGFEDVAADYAGHKPTAVEAAALLLRLHSAPMYFHRKGRGRFRRAPPDILQAALAGVERKRQQALAIERMADELVAGRLPAEFPAILPELLYKPDRNKAETKALEAACERCGRPAIELLAACGAVPDSHAFHLGRFLLEYFPAGTAFPGFDEPESAFDLPLAPVRAFSIDDAHTTEIDDAFSVTRNADGSLRIGIHIAAPGLGIAPESPLGSIARQRLSTVYMPGRKITMLPDAVVERFTLAEGRAVPALSLYLDVGADLAIRAHQSCIEQVPVVANLRHHDLEPVFNDATLAAGLTDFPFRDELELLWRLATVLEAGRGAAQTTQQRKEYGFHVDWSVTGDDGPGRVEIVERPRGSPLDKLVAELMIVANATWGALLRDAGVAALYRAQTVGKVRMTTVAAAHEGLGVDCYAWSSSPLRRFVDLVNQWQLIAHLRGDKPPYTARSAELLAAMRDFELTYAAYGEFQRGMENYWCLRWLRQNGVTRVAARVLRDNLVRLEDLPLVLKVSSLPTLDRGARVALSVERTDLLTMECAARYLELLPVDGADSALGEDDDGE
jgi:exoribonuclease-2